MTNHVGPPAEIIREHELCLACLRGECPECGGFGTKTYSSTSGASGGMGGQTISSFPCPACHGSGRKCQPWHAHPWEHEHVIATRLALEGEWVSHVKLWVLWGCGSEGAYGQPFHPCGYAEEFVKGKHHDYWAMSEEVGGWYEEAEGLFSTGWSDEEYAEGRPQGFQPTPKKAVCRAYMSKLYREPKH